jgi:hypothetical protein
VHPKVSVVQVQEPKRAVRACLSSRTLNRVKIASAWVGYCLASCNAFLSIVLPLSFGYSCP